MRVLESSFCNADVNSCKLFSFRIVIFMNGFFISVGFLPEMCIAESFTLQKVLQVALKKIIPELYGMFLFIYQNIFIFIGFYNFN